MSFFAFFEEGVLFMSTDIGQRSTAPSGWWADGCRLLVINEIIFLTEEQKDIFFKSTNYTDFSGGHIIDM